MIRFGFAHCVAIGSVRLRRFRRSRRRNDAAQRRGRGGRLQQNWRDVVRDVSRRNLAWNGRQLHQVRWAAGNSVIIVIVRSLAGRRELARCVVEEGNRDREL